MQLSSRRCMPPIAGNALWLAAGNKSNPVGYDLSKGKTIISNLAAYDACQTVARGRDIGALNDEFLIYGA